MWIVNIFKRLVRIPLFFIGMAFMIAMLILHPVWWIVFGAEWEDTTCFIADVWEFFLNLTDPNYDWDYTPPPPDNLGW